MFHPMRVRLILSMLTMMIIAIITATIHRNIGGVKRYSKITQSVHLDEKTLANFDSQSQNLLLLMFCAIQHYWVAS